jgi:hypothetical protein
MTLIRLRSTFALAAASLACLSGFWAGTASATFHLMQVREVYRGSAANPDAQYVELQMFASGQNLVAGHALDLYDGTGDKLGTVTFPANVANGANQSTIVVATPQAEAQFGFTADAPLNVAGGIPSIGAVCWENIDCVSWSSFSGSNLPSPAGTPAPAIPEGMALQRTIARGCPTALDGPDDTDDSAADFAFAAPNPRPNSVPPTEQRCAGAGGGTPPEEGPPQTTLRRKPPKRTTDRTPTFRFVADQAYARFQCKVDRKPFRGCRSPYTTKRLALGRHVFRVRAVSMAGKVDPTPAVYRFTVIAPRR